MRFIPKQGTSFFEQGNKILRNPQGIFFRDLIKKKKKVLEPALSSEIVVRQYKRKFKTFQLAKFISQI